MVTGALLSFVGQITSSIPGGKKLFSQSIHMLQNRHLIPFFSRYNSCYHASGSAADDHCPSHDIPPKKFPPVRMDNLPIRTG